MLVGLTKKNKTFYINYSENIMTQSEPCLILFIIFLPSKEEKTWNSYQGPASLGPKIPKELINHQKVTG